MVVGFKPLALNYKICIRCRVSDNRGFIYIVMMLSHVVSESLICDFYSTKAVPYTHLTLQTILSVATDGGIVGR